MNETDTMLQMHFNLTDRQVNLLTDQQKDILFYIFCYGSITPMEAFSELGITKLATRISEMKVLGIQFDQTYESRVNRVGRNVRYMRYRKAA